jgi:hypothetical protein
MLTCQVSHKIKFVDSSLPSIGNMICIVYTIGIIGHFSHEDLLKDWLLAAVLCPIMFLFS